MQTRGAEQTFYARRMPADLPCPVLIRLTLGSSVVEPREHVGLLLEWKQATADRGVTSWLGLVVFALPEAGKDGGWELRQRWMPAGMLTGRRSSSS